MPTVFLELDVCHHLTTWSDPTTGSDPNLHFYSWYLQELPWYLQELFLNVRLNVVAVNAIYWFQVVVVVPYHPHRLRDVVYHLIHHFMDPCVHYQIMEKPCVHDQVVSDPTTSSGMNPIQLPRLGGVRADSYSYSYLAYSSYLDQVNAIFEAFILLHHLKRLREGRVTRLYHLARPLVTFSS